MLASLADRPTNDDAYEATVFQPKPRPPYPSSPHNRDLVREHDLNLVNQFFPDCSRPAAPINLAKVLGASVSVLFVSPPKSAKVPPVRGGRPVSGTTLTKPIRESALPGEQRTQRF